MRVPTTLSLLLLSLVACEPMDDPGSPWKPVPVAAPAATGGPAVEAEQLPVPDPDFDVPEPIVLHSSQLGQPAPGEEPVAEAPAPVEEPVADDPVQEPAPAPVALYADPSVGFATSSFSTGAWPLRLVATVPGAQPPRAILGLPSGEEIVVTPGSMLPAAGVVVMAIGTESVDLAEIKPAGDHAVVQGRTLQSQRSQRIELGVQ